eukprot:7265035-Prymnesium_polylepis.1
MSCAAALRPPASQIAPESSASKTAQAALRRLPGDGHCGGGLLFTRLMSFWLFCSPRAPPTFVLTPPLTPNRARVARW